MSKDFQVDDLVWAKMKGYPPWPAKIAEPLPDTKPPKNKKAKFVYFFGSKNFAWILEDKISPHTEDYISNVTKKKSAPYHNAINELINFSKSSQKDEQSSSKRNKGLPRKVKSSDTGLKKESVPEKENNTKKREKITIKKENHTSKKKVKITIEDTSPVIKENIKKEEATPEKISIKEEKSGAPAKARNSTLRKKKDNTISNEKESSPIKSVNDTKKSRKKVVKAINSTMKTEKTVLTSKTLKKVRRKRPADRVKQEPSECSSPKNQKLFVKEEVAGSSSPSFRITDIPGTSMLKSTRRVSDKDEPENTNGFRLSKHVMPTTKKIGFIGLGNIGNGVVNNLLKSGHDVTVWNKTTYKCDSFVTLGAKKVQSPSELVLACDLIFCSVSDPDACKEVIFGERGILKGLDQAEKLQHGIIKGYIEMSSIHPDTSKEINEVISRKGAKYLEAPICGSSLEALRGSLIILAAGDRDLFLDCETCFHAMGKHAYFVSCEVGIGAKISLLLSVFTGNMYAAVAESLIMAKRLNLPVNDFMSVLCDGPILCRDVVARSRKMIYHDYETVTPLKHVQKDLSLTLALGNQFSQPMPVTAAANEVYKHAILLRYANADASAIYQGVRW